MTSRNKKIITRFPPSPTGFLHIGSVRTALFNYLFAKQHGGDFILRMEDTDRARSTKEYEDDITQGLAWLGLKHDNTTVVRQSERGSVYETYLKKMVEQGTAYISKEKVEKEGDRAEVVRFKNPNKKITFSDLIRGDITFDTTELGDFVIAKSLTEPLYHLAVVIDDFEAGVTHVIRGEDGISNTPRQILIQEAIGAPRPIYAHLPLILAPDRSKLSKRKHGEQVSLKYYREKGFIKEAVINFVGLLGWNPGDERELLSLEDFVKEFRIDKVQKGGAVFNEEKLRWINKEYIKKIPFTELEKIIVSFSPELSKLSPEQRKNIIPLLIEREDVFSGVKDSLLKGDWDFFFKKPTYEKASLVWKKSTPEKASEYLLHVQKIINEIPEQPFTLETVKEKIWPYAEKEGKGDVLWPLRVALSGKEKSPDPFTLAGILGKKEVLERIQEALG
ncbi:MAG: hypothetical protein RJA61_461 [Candidatus Parcubacteria bacterium]